MGSKVCEAVPEGRIAIANGGLFSASNTDGKCSLTTASIPTDTLTWSKLQLRLSDVSGVQENLASLRNNPLGASCCHWMTQFIYDIRSLKREWNFANLGDGGRGLFYSLVLKMGRQALSMPGERQADYGYLCTQ